MSDADQGLEFDISFALRGNGLDKATQGLAAFRGALKQGQAATFEFEQGGEKMRATIARAAEAAGRAGGVLEGLAGRLGGVTLAAGVMAGAVAAAVRGLHMLDEFGTKAVEAFGERSGTLRTWTALLGDAKQATEEFSRTQQLALKTPFLSSILEQTKTQLMGQDLRNEGGAAGGTLDKTTLALADLASRHHDRNQALQRGTYAVDEILSQGHLSHMRARQLSIDLMLPQRKMAEALGMTMEQFDQALKKGTITAGGPNDKFLGMLQKAAVLHTKESRLGETATAGGGSLSTALINQQEQMKNLLKTFDSELLPGVVRYKNALQEQGRVMTLGTQRGRDLSLVLQDFANTSTHVKATVTDFTTGFLEAFSSSYLSTLRALGTDVTEEDEKWKQAGLAARGLAGYLGDVLGPALAGVRRGFDSLLDSRVFRFLVERGERQKAETDEGSEVMGAAARAQKQLEEEARAERKEQRSVEQDKSADMAGMMQQAVAQAQKSNLQAAAETTKSVAEATKPLAEAVKGKDQGWAVPWARRERYAPSWDGGTAPVQRFGEGLAEQARLQMQAGALPRLPVEQHQHDETISIVINVQGGRDSAHDVARAVEERLDEKLRQLGRFQRGPSPKRD